MGAGAEVDEDADVADDVGGEVNGAESDEDVEEVANMEGEEETVDVEEDEVVSEVDKREAEEGRDAEAQGIWARSKASRAAREESGCGENEVMPESSSEVIGKRVEAEDEENAAMATYIIHNSNKGGMIGSHVNTVTAWN
jgi:hypothetical protein